MRRQGALAVGAIMDRISGRLKLVSCALMAVSTLSYLVFSLNAAAFMPPLTHRASVRLAYTTGILGGCAFNMAMPLQFELMMEVLYGWADEGIGSMLSVRTVILE